MPSGSSSPGPLVAEASSVDDTQRRRGCTIDDPGNEGFRAFPLGVAGIWLHVPARLPEDYPVLLHFHGGEPARRLVVGAKLNVVLATLDAGTGSESYVSAVKEGFDARFLEAVSETTGRPPGSVLVSAWSAGYGAVRSLLGIAPEFASAYLLLDAVHASYDTRGEPETAHLAPFEGVVARAIRGAPIVWLTHSSIEPGGYASTTEVADALLRAAGGRRRFGGLELFEGLEVRTRFDDGALHVLGTSGADKPAHCSHLRMLPTLLEREVLPKLRAQ